MRELGKIFEKYVRGIKGLQEWSVQLFGWLLSTGANKRGMGEGLGRIALSFGHVLARSANGMIGRVAVVILIVSIMPTMDFRLRQETAHAGPTVTLTIGGAGRGSGKVTSFDDINCTIVAGAVSGDCTENYEQGTYITLTATREPGSSFIRWS